MADMIEIRTYALDDDGNSQCIDIEQIRRDEILPLAENAALSAVDLGCESGSLHRIDALDIDGSVVDSIEIPAL